MSQRATAALLISVLMLTSVILTIGFAGAAVPAAPASAPAVAVAATPVTATPAPTVASAATSTVTAPTLQPVSSAACSSLETVNNDPDYATFVNHVHSIASGEAAAGVPSSDINLPYTGPVADQPVNGVPEAGAQLSNECSSGVQATGQTEPTGVAYDGAMNTNTGIHDLTLDSNSVEGILTVNSQSQNLYPGSGTPTQWGGQENVVMPNVTIDGHQGPTSKVTFSLPNGVYQYSDHVVTGFTVSPLSGTLTVNGAPLTQIVTYAAGSIYTYPVTFTESGLHAGTSWSVVVNGVTTSGTTTSLTANVPNGTFAYTVTAVAGYTVSPASGTLTVNGAAVGVSVTFVQVAVPHYIVTFTESGLVWGTSWTVTFNGVPYTTTAVRINVTATNGSYSYTVGTVSGYTASPSSGTITVSGAAVAQTITWTSSTSSTYVVTFIESGVPYSPSTTWGVSMNGVSSTASTATYAFWDQNVISYDSFNDTISFVDDTWNFTSGSSDMFTSSLVSWSPNGGNYTGVWVAFSPYYYAPPPFTAIAWVNSSVNSAGDQVLWYNYSVYSHGHYVAAGNYDYLVFKSQPATGGPVTVAPPTFEASAHTTHEVTEGYEFDAFIGADDGANNLILNANATMQVQYCTKVPYCTPTSFSYANVPAAVNYGSQTGEQTAGVAVNFVGTTAYMSSGPLITHGLWNYTGARAWNVSGAIPVTNAITVSGAPLAPLSTQPYVFVFFENTNFTSQGYQWAPDVPTWFLMPGVYNYEVMLADYTMQNGTFAVSGARVTLSAVLPYNALMGVYTPLWAFSNGQLAGISTSGSGTIGSQYVLFNNPTTGYFGFTANNLSSNFYSVDDYHFPTYTGLILDGTNVYVNVNAPVSFAVRPSTGGSTTYYLGLELFETSHVTISHDNFLKGWPSWEEISFYISVPSSQNPAPQAELFVWNSTNDLISSNTFVGTQPTSGSYVAPDALVLYGGGHNTVWNNTFRDPPGVAFGTTYAGIALAEDNDLIYNNNFSVDNPVVDTPFNWANTADCLPQSLGGCGNTQAGNGWFYNTQTLATWNVTPQSASNVVNTVNGFALKGNVLGSQVTTQGGNYYWNYGLSPNNLTTSPYVSRFYYSDWSNIFPLGCGSIQAPGAPCGTAPPVVGAYQNGIQQGGDYAAYGPTITFSETGLAPGGTWAVVYGGHLYVLSSTSLTLNGPYSSTAYTISAVGSSVKATPSSGTAVPNGAYVIHVVFAAAPASTYSIYFTASGIYSGTSWSVTINGNTLSSLTSTIVFTGMVAGGYSYTITAPAGYTATPSSGSVTVTSVSTSVGIVFAPVTYTVTFTESGLPGGTMWGLAFGGVFHWSTGTTITFQVVGGVSYNWQIGQVTGYPAAPSSGSTGVISGPYSQGITFT